MTWLPVGLASGALALAVSRTRAFRPLRDLVWPGHEDEPPAPLPPGARGWAAYLVTCYVCLGFWVSGVLTALQGVDEGMVPLVSWLAAWGISSLLAAAVDRMAE